MQVRANKVLIVVGETGSGKTTQIPQFLLQSGLADISGGGGGKGGWRGGRDGGGGGMIACTQPRRVAAVTVARRVAEEMGVQLGQKVGYSIRFDDCTSPSTRIKYMTDGMLLRECLLDPLLNKYKVVIVDEAHERTVSTDVLLGLLKGVAARRGDDFRLLVMSATLDAEAFSKYFGGARAVWVQGRQHPVAVMCTTHPEDNYLDAALNAVLQVHCEEGPGDILVFLTGQEEIEGLERLLMDRAAALPDGAAGRGGGPEELLVLPIYAALPPEQQMRVFDPAPAGSRKAILATNIAETSITIPGVRYVVDTGFVKARGYHAKLGADSLQVVPVSQAQARQRSGRAGREGPGKAYRLYTLESFKALAPTTPPEILRSNLASTVLQLKALGVEDVVGFDFMDKPPRAAVVRRALSDVCGAFCNGGSGAVITVPFAPARPPLPV
ncbi:RNA helicase [Monoraphidium neglectum]|uniref:RNA helicase n=1 Tax=Monoraphidium neglectum TaxID=145388 RepID=A0A0D2MB23_9CHLO|nr:RNA helicase [Monoraphidium neglectum]KIY98086.1 RNA helicase [Monoraphidium neglectum]|eukprot:XP_013897106.1 RNA helicase [Monoraphidium neglectum]